ncbi:MAG: shikimate dehydrogenase [Ignavibacteriaceae bacterium]|nr:shikimate dehydrogenase [Ignavibacteriaceae bacterium]
MKNTLKTETKIIGLIGHPIKHSYSPFIFNVSLEITGFDFIYLPFDVPPTNLKNAIRGMTALGIKGFNVTIPHKVSVLPMMNELSEEASVIGSVNTIVSELGKLKGFNTDVYGILESLTPFKDKINGSTATVVGAGGGARAVIFTLIRHFKPSGINLINRTEQRAESLKRYFSGKMRYDSLKVYELFPPGIVDVLSDSVLIVNATSVGMTPDVDDSISDLNKSFNKNQIVFDLVYNPIETKLLKIAAAEGAVTINGLNMLVHQAAKSFELWTGEQMPVEKVKHSLELFISK